jgi:predicted dehydrogenase
VSIPGPVTAVLCGAGVRGHFVYGDYARRHPRRLRFVAVAEPDAARRRRFQRTHGIPAELAFDRWQDLLAGGRRAEAAFVCTPDAAHAAPAHRALELGYHLLLEKPVSPLLEECRELAAFPLADGQIAQVAHVLRYTGFWRRVKEAVAQGRIGRVVHFELSENVSTWHFSHSFVRGAYGVQRLSSPLILAKCCHDLDLIGWILAEKAHSVQSAGGLQHYRPENAPPGAPERCTDGCPAQAGCPWFAPRLYLRGEPILRALCRARSPWLRGLVRLSLAVPSPFKLLGAAVPALGLLADWNEFPSTALGVDLSRAGKMRALREGPFGRCVYRCGNDVPDHQQVLLSFPSGATAALTVHGLSEFEGRELRVFGTKGVLRGVFRLHEEELALTDNRRLKTSRLHRRGVFAGHGGGDQELLDAFTAALSGRVTAAEVGLSGIAEALESHLLAFAAEAARRRGTAVAMQEYRGVIDGAGSAGPATDT